MFASRPYKIGRKVEESRLLDRFLPPSADGVVSDWLHGQVPPGGWIIDPFGASPRLAIEAAQAGYRVLVVVNNPIARFLLEIAATRPNQADLRAALSELAASRRGEERLEPHVRAQYQTQCATCGLSIMADAYLWERGATSPYGCVYHCPHCGDEGEHATTARDVQLATQFAASGIHRARALERVALPHDPDRVHVEEAISHYLPRSIYILFTLINRLDGLSVTPDSRRNLQALLLYALDRGNTLWGYPSSRPRPRSLVTPTRFRENNLWLALEEAVAVCGETSEAPKIPIFNWPQQPPTEGGISLFEGRLKDLSSTQNDHPFQAVVTAIPRHNQAYWTLSALWAGWLWGREAVGPFKVVLHRRWYDWAWHTAALTNTLQYLASIIKEGTPFFGLLSEAEPGFLMAALTSADATGFALDSLALNEDEPQAQLIWNLSTTPSSNPSRPTPEAVAQLAIQAYLLEKGEPSGYFGVLSAGLQGIVEQRLIWQTMNPVENPAIDNDSDDETTSEVTAVPKPHLLYNMMNASIRKVLTNQSVFTHVLPTDQHRTGEPAEKAHRGDLESGWYWLYTDPCDCLPLSDRIEIELVRYLSKQDEWELLELNQCLNNTFPGLFTPPNELLKVCIDSYAEAIPNKLGYWHLRPQDHSNLRRKDLNDVREMLVKIGKLMGLQVQEVQAGAIQGRTMMIWSDQFGQPLYYIYPIASAVIGDIIFQEKHNRGKNLIVIPGSRANLVTYKVKRDPRLAEKCSSPAGWQFLRFRQIRWLLKNPLLNQDSLTESLALDPLTYSTPQLRFL